MEVVRVALVNNKHVEKGEKFFLNAEQLDQAEHCPNYLLQSVDTDYAVGDSLTNVLQEEGGSRRMSVRIMRIEPLLLKNLMKLRLLWNEAQVKVIEHEEGQDIGTVFLLKDWQWQSTRRILDIPSRGKKMPKAEPIGERNTGEQYTETKSDETNRALKRMKL